MFGLLGKLWNHRQLVRGFVVRDLKARYVGSSMGFFWSVIVPFLNLFIFMVVFSLILNSRWADDADPAETALIMLVGILAWQAFSETLSRSTNCLVENANLIQKVVFPSEILPAFLTISALINMLIGLPITIVGVWIFADQRPGASYVMLPVLLVLQAIFTIGLGFLLSTLNLFLRDTFHLIGVLTMVWMFGTPIFYPAHLVKSSQIPIPFTKHEVTGLERRDSSEWMTRIPTNGSATLELAENESIGPVWSRTGIDELPADQESFFDPNGDGAENQFGVADKHVVWPDSLGGYVAVNGVAYKRVLKQESDTFSLSILLDLNPMYWLITCYREILIYGKWPNLIFIFKFGVVSLIVLFIGSRFFSKHQSRFPDLL
ncbi:MAG: ABC-type polysaccharide/polyol phosphate export permease [Planctomycetota bacterium]|jgi:ABC-type polysaccharide/polyol phosphate export permease